MDFPDQPGVSIARQCEALRLSRSTCYYQPVGASDHALHRSALRAASFHGLSKIAQQLDCKTASGFSDSCGGWESKQFNRKRRTTWPDRWHKIYPYLLRNVAITHPNHVWSSDITYVPMSHGFLY